VSNISLKLGHTWGKVRKKTNKCYTSLDRQVQMKNCGKVSYTIHMPNTEKGPEEALV